MIRLLVDEDFNNDILGASAGECPTSMRRACRQWVLPAQATKPCLLMRQRKTALS
jgi:hypothetical protein